VQQLNQLSSGSSTNSQILAASLAYERQIGLGQEMGRWVRVASYPSSYLMSPDSARTPLFLYIYHFVTFYAL
jgi:hypothetical protein